MIGFERIVKIKPPYERRAEGYGIGTMQIWMILKGPKGATQFMFSTGTHTNEVADEILIKGEDRMPSGNLYNPFQARGWDVGFHAVENPGYYEESDKMECDILDEGECFYDGSGLRADEWLKAWFESGQKEEFIWKRLEEDYMSRFENE